MGPVLSWQFLRIDTRDFEFAQKFNLPIVCIQDPDVAGPEQKKRILGALNAGLKTENTSIQLIRLQVLI